MTQQRGDLCSLCDRPVLGLAAQDWCVLPWMLDARAASAEILLGPCHVRCLDELGAARDWADAVEDYHCVRWPRPLFGVDDGVRWRLHSNPRQRQFHLWRADARLASFPYAAVRAAEHGVLRVTTEVAEVGSAQAAVLLAAMGTEENGVPVRLDRVIAALGLTDRYPPIAPGLPPGSLVRRLTNLGSARCPELIDVLVAHHPLPLSPPCLRAAHELMRRGA